MPEETDPPVREFADRGVLWLLESPRNLAALVELIAAEIADRLDFDRAERVNRSFIPEDLHKQEADLLYRVPFRKVKGEVWIYVLVENQSKPDRTMGLRILSYMVQLWELQRRGFEDTKLPVSKWKLFPILPIVFYSGKRRWRRPIRLAELMDLPELLAPFVPQFETLLLPLQELPPQQLTKTALASALRALQAADEPMEELQQALREAVASLERLPEEAKPEWRRALRFIYLLLLHKRDASERSLLVETIETSLAVGHEREGEEVLMTGAQELIREGKRIGREEGKELGREEGKELGREEGKELGREEGKEIGRAEGQRVLLLTLLSARFGPLSDVQQGRLNALSETQIQSLAQSILTATSLAKLGL